MTMGRGPILSHREIAEKIVDTINVYGRQYHLRYANEDRLIYFVTEALQAAFDRGFRAAGGTVAPACGETTPQTKEG